MDRPSKPHKARKGKINYVVSPNLNLHSSSLEFSVHTHLASPDLILSEADTSLISSLRKYATFDVSKRSEFVVVYPTILSFMKPVHVRVMSPNRPYFHTLATNEELYIYYPCILTFHTSQTSPPANFHVKTHIFYYPDGLLTDYRLSIISVLRSVGDRVSGVLTFSKTTLVIGNPSGISFRTDTREVCVSRKEEVMPSYDFLKLPAGTYELFDVLLVSGETARAYLSLREECKKYKDRQFLIMDPADCFVSQEDDDLSDDLPLLGPGSDILSFGH